MKLHILSDIHLEFGPFEPPDVGADVVILAGDIAPKLQGVRWALATFKVPVIYVAGNHEYYGGAIPHLTEKLRAACAGTQVHFLERETLVIDGVRFVGAALWTDFLLRGQDAAEVAMGEARAVMNDYKKIRVSPRFSRLTPNSTVMFHHQARAFIRNTLTTPHQGPTVVVTHHAPSARSLSSGQPSLTDCAYASDLESLILETQPDLWVHGHVHARSDYAIGRTRVVCNPRGYTDEPCATFDPAFSVTAP
ncbi:MAG: metallophosphoesterase [Myxococcota bacterium]